MTIIFDFFLYSINLRCGEEWSASSAVLYCVRTVVAIAQVRSTISHRGRGVRCV